MITNVRANYISHRIPLSTKSALTVAGKKGRVMERRILKDFQIGLVEGIVNEVLVKSHEPKDVFSQIAKAIGTRSSSKSKNWNDLVRKNTVVRDPIGSTQASIHRVHRRSLRRAIIDNAHKGLDMNTDKLLEYNPLLSEVSQTTRVAYVKFMTKKMRKDDHMDSIILENEAEGQPKVPVGGEGVSAKEAFGSIIKKASIKRRESEEEMKLTAPIEPTISAAAPVIESPRPDIKDFRCRTPIVEDPNEDRVMSPEMKNYDPAPSSLSPPEKSPSPHPPPTPISSPIPKATSSEPPPSDDDDGEQSETAAGAHIPGDLLPVPVVEGRPQTPKEGRGEVRRVPPIIITSSKGKSAVSGRNLEGWI